MRRIGIVLLAAAGIGLSGAASAADLGTAPIYRKAPAAVPFTWTGSYIGGYVGGAFGAQNTVTSVPVDGTGAPVFAGPAASYKYDGSVIGGYTGGYNWQVAPNWVIGYEGETGYMGNKGSAAFAGSATSVATTRVEGIYSAWTARLGYAVDRSLVYAKGGLALAEFKTGVFDGTLGINTVEREYRLGYAVGAGWEYAFDPKWSAKIEYLYLGFDKNVTTAGGFPAPLVTTTRLPGIHTVKVGANYKFDWFGLLR
jgi:outer membrane immunogenic protein